VRHTRIIVTHYGGPDALQVAEEECPEPKSGEVRVRVLAAGVSLPDVMKREGMHPETPRRDGDVRYVFSARSAGRFRHGRYSD
jgi:NADPH:quinone reductase-like Zn-dependent oxidoreductase